jgi:hypothetical protein
MTPDDLAPLAACPRCSADAGEPCDATCPSQSPPDDARVTAVLALDIDGVVCDAAFQRAALGDEGMVARWTNDMGRRTIDPARVARVQRICDETGAAIVIVSGRRSWATAEEIASWLRSAGLTAPVLGAVGGIKFSGADLRQTALREWLDEHPEVTRWCVVDDLVSAWESTRNVERRELFRGRMTMVHTTERFVAPWLVGRCVHPRDGITDADADAAVAILTRAT